MSTWMTSRETEAIERVIAAWSIKGVVPTFHDAQKAKLRREWPTLYLALDHLEQVMPKP